MKEWSTFADGGDCRECECLEAENDKLRADLEVAKEVLCALIESIETPARLGLATINKDWEALNAAREALAKLGDKPEGE